MKTFFTTIVLLIPILLFNIESKNGSTQDDCICINSIDRNNKFKIEGHNKRHILTYIGSELNSLGETIFFISKTDSITITSDQLTFSLKDLKFSKTPINFLSKKFDTPKESEIPSILKFPLRFHSITKNNFEINIIKISDTHDSKSNKLAFKCSKN